MNNKGNLFDIITYGVLLFALLLIFIIISSVYTSIAPELQGVLNTTGTSNVSQVNDNFASGRGAYATLANMFPYLLIGFILVILFYAYYVKTTPVLFFVAIIVIVIAVIISSMIADTSKKITMESGAFENVKSDWEGSAWYVNRLPIITILVSSLVIIMLFIRSRSVQAV